MTPQKIVLVIGLLAFTLCVLYPPWVHTAKSDGAYSEQNAGYHRIDKPPPPKIKNIVFGVKLDASRLTVQLVGVSVATLVLWIIARRCPNSSEGGSSGNRKSS